MTPHEIATIACLAAGGICGAWFALRQRKPAPEPKECETVNPRGHVVEGGTYRYLINGQWVTFEAACDFVILRDYLGERELAMLDARTYAEAFAVEPPASRLRSLPAWDAAHQRAANVTQPLLPAERPW